MKALAIDWDAQPLGKRSDRALGRELGCSDKVVRRQRVKRGIPAFGSTEQAREEARERRSEMLSEAGRISARLRDFDDETEDGEGIDLLDDLRLGGRRDYLEQHEAEDLLRGADW